MKPSTVLEAIPIYTVYILYIQYIAWLTLLEFRDGGGWLALDRK